LHPLLSISGGGKEGGWLSVGHAVRFAKYASQLTSMRSSFRAESGLQLPASSPHLKSWDVHVITKRPLARLVFSVAEGCLLNVFDSQNG